MLKKLPEILSRCLFAGVFLGITLTQSGCTPANSANTKSEKAWVLGLSADYPPFEFKKDGEIVGFDVDLARELAKEIGLTLSIEDMDFNGLILALKTGRIDFVMAGMTVTEERKKNVDFSDIYFNSSFSIVVPKESKISKESDLGGKKIGAQLGSTMEKYAKNKATIYPGLEVVALSKNPVLIQELKSSRLDGVLSEEVQAAAFVKANPTLKYVNLEKTKDGYAIAFAKGSNQPMINQVNAALKKLQSNGTLNRLRQKWLGN